MIQTTAREIADAVQEAVAAERKRCLNVIATQQRQYAGGSAASIALGLTAIALNKTQ